MRPEYKLGRHRGKFVVTWYEDGQRRRHSLGTSDPAEADRLLKHFRSYRPDNPTVEWLWRQYVEDNQGKAVLETMKHTWKALAPRFGHLTPDLIKIADCRDHTAARRSAGIGDNTILNELGHMATVLNWAARHELIDRAPHIERPPKPAPRDRYLTRAEAQQLMDAATAHHLRLAIVLMLTTAARSRAILELTWDRVDFERGLIHLTNPDDTTRRKGRAVVPMNRSARAALEQARKAALTDHVIEWAGKPVGSIKKALARAAGKAKLAGVSAHVLRHSAAVWMAEAGRPMQEISQFLGHANTRITERVYARYSPDYLRGTAEVLELDLVQVNQRSLR